MRIFAALNLNLLHQIGLGSVVQLDRISDSGSEGWGFESLRGHKKKKEANFASFFFFSSCWLISLPLATQSAKMPY